MAKAVTINKQHSEEELIREIKQQVMDDIDLEYKQFYY